AGRPSNGDLTMGMGVSRKNWRLDFALSSNNDLGASQMVSLGMSFGQDRTVPLQVIPDAQEAIVAEELRKDFDVEVTEEKIRMILSEKILFDSGSAELKAEIFPALKKFAELAGTLRNRIIVE